MWQTATTRELGIELPFVGAGMGFYALPELVAAVSGAGGLGLIGASPAPAPVLDEWIGEVRRLTDRPFGVDLIVEQTAFGPSTTEEHVEVCAERRVPVVVFFWNPPRKPWLDRLQAAGCRVWMQVGALEAARAAVALGISAIIVQGSEAGGHNRSRSGLLSLVPRVVDAVAPVPVLAAGGIADGRGVAAALALGADAVVVGTRLLASHEARAHEELKRRLMAADVDDVVCTRIFGPEWPDVPMKVLRNRAVREAEEQGDGAAAPVGSPRTIGHTTLFGQRYDLPRHSALLPTPETEGDFEEMCLPAGEGVGLAQRTEPAATIVRSMMDEARATLDRLAATSRPARARRRAAESGPGARSRADKASPKRAGE